MGKNRMFLCFLGLILVLFSYSQAEAENVMETTKVVILIQSEIDEHYAKVLDGMIGTEGAEIIQLKNRDFYQGGSVLDDKNIDVFVIPSIHLVSDIPEESFWEKLIGIFRPKEESAPLSQQIVQFMERGGKLLALGGRPFSRVGNPPQLVALSPWYNTFEVKGEFSVRRTNEGPGLSGNALLDSVGSFVMPNWRNRGAGMAVERRYRWIPLLVAEDENGPRGAVASMVVNASKDYPRTAWGYIGVILTRENADIIGRLSADMIKALSQGVFLLQAGGDFAYKQGDKWNIGAEVVNYSQDTVEIQVVSRIEEVYETEPSKITLAPGEMKRLPLASFEGNLNPGVYSLFTELQIDGMTVDKVEQKVRVYGDLVPDPSQIVTVKDGQFMLDGKIWVPVGLNYWPRVTAGADIADYWPGRTGHWLNPAQYDPEIVDADLAEIAKLGMNMVAIQYVDPIQAKPLIDFLERCREYGIKVMVYGPGNNVGMKDWNPERSKLLIEAAELHKSDVMFAYDIRWEPHFGDENERSMLDGFWTEWVKIRYGSIENAEEIWGFKAPRRGTALTAPSNAQITQEGPHAVMVAAYRRFLDDWVSKDYQLSASLLREWDPIHLIGVRSGYGGNGSEWIDPRMPYDLVSGAKHLDFISPEGYALGTTWETIRPAVFITAYARWAGCGKPVFWPEMGTNRFSGVEWYRVKEYDEEAIKKHNEAYDGWGRYFALDGVGGAAWWFPGGFRHGENSDFGLFDPDGRPREAALAFSKWIPEILSQAERPKGEPDIVITIDRDLHPRGFSRVYGRAKNEYSRDIAAGKTIVMQTEATGTDTSNCPLVGIGNTPLTDANVPKYLNSEINEVYVRINDGPWQKLDLPWQALWRPEPILLSKGDSLAVRVVFGNTGEVKWLAPAEIGDNPGGVYIKVFDRTGRDDYDFRTMEVVKEAGLASTTARYEDGEFIVEDLSLDGLSERTLSMVLSVRERVFRFGEVLDIRLREK